MVGAVALLAALRMVLPVGFDFYHWYWPIPRAWLAGETVLYDDASRQFFSPPWTVWLLLPFSLLDLRSGMTLLAVCSLAAFLGVAGRSAAEAGARRPGMVAALATLSPYTLTVLFVGTLDGLALAGLWLAYRGVRGGRPWQLGAGLLLAAVRPQHLVVAGPLLLLGLRGWPVGALARAAALPAVVVAATVPFFGWDWPLRLWDSFTHYPSIPYLVTSTYAVPALAGLPCAVMVAGALALAAYAAVWVWRAGLGRPQFDLALAVNAVASPYMLSQSYSVLLAVPWAGLAVRRPLLAAALYAVGLPLLTRAGGAWDRIGLIDVTFPLLLCAALLWRPAHQPEGQPPVKYAKALETQ